MAAVFVPPSPKTSMNMSTRRPLANVPNATNSPHRTGLVPAKRVRSNQLEISYGQPPPKKQVMEAAEQNRSSVVQGADSKLFARRPNNANPSAFEKKLVAARDKERQPQVKAVKGEKPSADTLDTIRQWQRHYRKAFPQFVFYFDSVPEDARRKFSRQVVALGAREEKFFSRLVTHVVTSRPIPAGVSVTSPTEVDAVDGNGDGNVQTVNPSMLDKSADWLKHEIRRDQASNDVLQRARQMGMKIWALEKLQRMITTINDNDLGGQNDTAVRSRNAGASTANGRGENDLSRVLRQELMNGPSDRDPLSSMEMIVFKGPFIYIHDMNEKTKPVMVREYSRVAKRQDGAWPQFRSAPLGKCPFVDEPPSRKEYDRHRIRQSQKEKKAAAVAETRQNIPKTIEQEQKTVAKIDPDQAKIVCEKDEEFVSILVNSKPRADETHERKSSESFIPPHFPRSGPFYTGREPAASGVQPSNVTSAIRSQMISSTAAAPGARAGLSKEVHGLKRKVLERGTGNIAHGSMAAPERPNGLAMHLKTQHSHATNPAVGARHNLEEHNQEGAGIKRRRDDSHESEQKKPERRRDPKPGYCENCRDKFDDFEEHTLTRKHRRFAQNTSNWVELDALLAEIQRPLKNDLDRVS